MTEILPLFAQPEEPVFYDNSVQYTDIINVPCTQTDARNLNNGGDQLIFRFDGGQLFYRLSSPKTGIRVKYEFRTKTGANNDKDAATTLSSNFFGYCFQSAALKLKDYVVESVSNPGVVMDCLYHCEDADFRDKSGSRFGFIPDTSGETTTTIGTRSGDVDRTSANTGALADEVNAADNRVVTYNSAFNEGFQRRMKAFNYTVTGNGDSRYLDIFIPLNRIFSFCSEFDRVLTQINFEITLYRTNYHTNSIYGSANTSLDFGQNERHDNGGITAIQLEVERVTFRPNLALDIVQKLSKPITATYLRRICIEEPGIANQATGKFEHTFGGDQGIPRYVFCIFKSDAADTATNNFQRCVHADIQNISITYANQTYPNRPQNCAFLQNEFTRFYDDFCEVARSLGFNNSGLTWEEFRDMYTVFAIDISAQPLSYEGGKIIVNFARRAKPAGNTNPQNPQTIRGFCVILSQCTVEIDCNNRRCEKK